MKKVKDWTEIPYGKLNAATQRFFGSLGDKAGKVIDRMNTDPEYMKRNVRYAINGGYEAFTSQKKARVIMGKNFFGIENAISCFGVNPSIEQLDILDEVPWSEEILTSCKDTHILVAKFPISILEIEDTYKRLFRRGNIPDGIYPYRTFYKYKGEIGWHLVRKTPVTGSANKTWNEQLELLLEEEKTLSAGTLVYATVGHFLTTAERLFQKTYVRCADIVVSDKSPSSAFYSPPYHALFGCNDKEGIRFGGYTNDRRDVDIELSSEMRRQS